MTEIKFDQHFMICEEIIDKIVETAKLSKYDTILEIGPGKGALTKKMVNAVKKVICIEIDEDNLEYLNFKKCDVHKGNALKLIDKFEYDKIISNLPYCISEALFKKLGKINFDLCVFTIGKKFYNVLIDENTKLFHMCNCLFELEYICDVDRKCFDPAPKVDSCIIKIEKKYDNSLINRVLKSFFMQQDKLLKNALIKSFRDELQLTKNEAKELVSKLNVDDNDLNMNSDLISNDKFINMIDKLKTIIESDFSI